MLVQVESSEKPPPEIISQFGLHEIPVDGIRLIEVLKDSQLKEFTEDVKSKLKVGRSFYEYQGEFKDLPEQSKVIFMDEVMTKPIYQCITNGRFIVCYIIM